MQIRQKLLLVKAVLTQNGTSLRKTLSACLDEAGHFYSGVHGDTEPFGFLGLIDRDGRGLAAALSLDFADIALHDFLGGARDLPKNHISEREVSEFLGRLVLTGGASTVIEIGCYVGVTTAHIARALHASGRGRVFCVDIKQKHIDITSRNLAALGLRERLHPLCGDSLDPRIIAQLPDQADVIFIDSSHNYHHTRREIEAYALKLSDRGCLVLHDAIQWPGVRRAVQEVWEDYSVMTFATRRGNGVAVLMNRRDRIATAQAAH